MPPPYDFVAHRSSTASREGLDDEEGDSFSYTSSVAGEGKTPRKGNGASSSRRFRCLSSRASSIIGLPRRPDTKFRKQDFSARLRSSFSRKCRRAVPLFPGVPREAVANSKNTDNGLKIYDPGSPDVSCVGRIKLKQKEKELKTITSSRREDRPQGAAAAQRPKQRRFAWIKKLLFGPRKVDDSNRAAPAPAASTPALTAAEEEYVSARGSCASCPPQLSQMKRFSSQREPEGLANFSIDNNTLDSDVSQELGALAGSPLKLREGEGECMQETEGDSEKSGLNSKGEEEPDVLGLDVWEEVENGPLSRAHSVAVPAAAINLWRRRSVAPPMPLELRSRSALEFRRPLTA